MAGQGESSPTPSHFRHFSNWCVQEPPPTDLAHPFLSPCLCAILPPRQPPPHTLWRAVTFVFPPGICPLITGPNLPLGKVPLFSYEVWLGSRPCQSLDPQGSGRSLFQFSFFFLTFSFVIIIDSQAAKAFLRAQKIFEN